MLVWTHREVPASTDAAWSLFTDLDRWPEWGPSVRAARLDGDDFVAGATGRVTTALGPTLPFEITEVTDDGDRRRWAWKVAGVPATAHTVDDLGGGRARIGFGVPAVVAPYLIVCRVALARMADALAD